ncbi:hypothetical protein V8C35DRAFT_296539 [Trichoderma chlorosporum]
MYAMDPHPWVPCLRAPCQQRSYTDKLQVPSRLVSFLRPHRFAMRRSAWAEEKLDAWHCRFGPYSVDPADEKAWLGLVAEWPKPPKSLPTTIPRHGRVKAVAAIFPSAHILPGLPCSSPHLGMR